MAYPHSHKVVFILYYFREDGSIVPDIALRELDHYLEL
jgi:hypothetical protein